LIYSQRSVFSGHPVYKTKSLLKLEVLEDYSAMIEGAVDTIKYIQEEMKLKVGSSTGFTSPMVDILKRVAAKQGYFPDAIVAADEVRVQQMKRGL